MRINILGGILLLVLAGYLASPWIAPYVYRWQYGVAPEPPLPGKNEVKGVDVVPRPDGQWTLRFEYFYTGAPEAVSVEISHWADRVDGSEVSRQITLPGGAAAQRGAHKHEWVLPFTKETGLVSRRVTVALRDLSTQAEVASASVDRDVLWPTAEAAQAYAILNGKTPEAAVNLAGAYVDKGDEASLKLARRVLLAVVNGTPQVESAYVELSRVTMKQNWTQEGLRDAESLLRSALQLRPDSVDARVVLAYVRGWQNREAEAEALFTELAAIQPPVANLWLWVNWGELRERQGRADEALEKYRQALAVKPTGDRMDQARESAYDRAIRLLERRSEADAAEALHRQHIADYPQFWCHPADYARFLALWRGDTAEAQRQLDAAAQCDPEYRRTVGALVTYIAWSQAEAAPGTELLLKARALAPVSPRLMADLAISDRGVAVVRKLVASAGEKVDRTDGQQMNALAYALANGEIAAAERLLKAGARTDALVGQQPVPVALIPVMARQFDAIRLLRRAGVDYGRLRLDGVSVLEHVRRSGDQDLLRALEGGGGKSAGNRI